MGKIITREDMHGEGYDDGFGSGVVCGFESMFRTIIIFGYGFGDGIGHEYGNGCIDGFGAGYGIGDHEEFKYGSGDEDGSGGEYDY